MMTPHSDTMIDWLIESQIEQHEIWLEEQFEEYCLNQLGDDDVNN